MAVQTLADYSDILKEYYVGQRVMQLVLSESPLLAMGRKAKMGGKTKPLPMIDGDTPGVSSSYTVANANKGGVSSEAFQIAVAKHYALANLDRLLAVSSEDSSMAFLSNAKANIDGALRQLSKTLAIHAYRDGTGARGRVASYAAGVITLTQRYDAVNFSRGMRLQFNAVKTGTAVDATIFTVTGTNPVTGTITGTVTVGPDPDANDYIFAEGDKGIVMQGLRSWITEADPTATPFFGVDRTTNPVMWAGVRSNGTGKLRYEALIDAESEINAIGGGKPTAAFCHPSDFRALKKELQQQVERPTPVNRDIPVMKDSKYVISVSGIVVQGDTRQVEVYSDRFQQPGYCDIIELETFGFDYAGPGFTHFVQRDSDMGMILDESADSYTVRAISYAQTEFSAPGHSGVITNFGL